MSDIKITVQDDNDKDLEKNNIFEQASLDTSLDMRPDENEEKDVRRSVLHKEERETGRDELKNMDDRSNKIFSIFGQEYIVAYNQPPPNWQQDQGQGQNWVPQGPQQGPQQGQGQGWFPQGPQQGPQQGQGQGWFSQGPQQAPQQGQGQGWFSQGPQQGQGQAWFPQGPQQGQGQGWFSQGPQPGQGPGLMPQGPQQGQGQGWFSQGPGQGQEEQQEGRRPRHAEYSSGPPLDYSEDKEDRNVFVRKVMLILLVMLLVTTAFMLVVIFVEPLKRIFRRFSLFIFFPCIIVLMIMSCIMPTASCARKSPTNYMCLVIVVILESLVTAAVTARYSTHIILQAFLATLACVALCVILAYTKFDFTKCILFVLCVLVALSVVAMGVMVARFVFGFYSKPLMIVLLVAFTIANVVMLIIELQMVLGGKSVELSEEDYALGAYMLYTSIVQLFLNLVQLLGIIDS